MQKSRMQLKQKGLDLSANILFVCIFAKEAKFMRRKVFTLTILLAVAMLFLACSDKKENKAEVDATNASTSVYILACTSCDKNT